MNDRDKFENVLRSFRVRMGDEMKQERAASAISAYGVNVSFRKYWAWEKGEKTPKPKELKAIVAAFHLNAEEEDTLYRSAAQQPQRLWIVPFVQNPFFTGRETHLQQLHELLTEHKTVCVCGMGGIGKTQLAVVYAHRSYPGVYRTILWVNAAEQAMLHAGYDELTRALGLPEQHEAEIDKRVQAVKRWLEGHHGWLLIMDNADDLMLAHSFLPSIHPGSVLFTARSPIVGTITRYMDLPIMEPKEAGKFLMRRANRSSGNHDDAEQEHATEVARLLGALPLALEQAAAYVEETGVSFAAYIQLFREYRNYLLHRHGSLEMNHPESIATTIEMSVQKVSKAHPLSLHILYFCTFLQPDTIPEELLHASNIFSNNILGLNEGIAALSKQALLHRYGQKNMFSMHRLVQEIIRDMLDHDTHLIWEKAILQAMAAIYPQINNKIGQYTVKQWDQCERLLPHIQACTEWPEDDLFSMPGIDAIFFCEAKYLQMRGRNIEAERLITLALNIYERRPDVNILILTDMMDSLARIHRKKGDNVQAEALEQRIAGLTAHSDKSSLEVLLQRFIQFTELLMNTDDVHAVTQTSKKIEKEVIEIISQAEKLLSSNHCTVGLMLCQLGNVYLEQQKYNEADGVLTRALRIFESQVEPDHPHIAQSIYSLIIVRCYQEEFEEAETWRQRWMQIERQRVGCNDPDVEAAGNSLRSFIVDAHTTRDKKRESTSSATQEDRSD